MVINHNISAMNTYRAYNTNQTAASKSMEKLSSGLRINSASDDAAGLSISEKMKSQIAGLGQATRNAQDGTSLIQTAEGSMSEVSDMLVRMKELAVQVSNGTYSSDDQKNIGAEMKSLGTEMDDIISKTKFNSISVFTTATTITYGENADQSITVAAATTTNLSHLTGLTAAADTTPQAVTSDDVEKAISEINTQRATYGAQENQLNHVVNNLGTSGENIQAAESRIADVDMAKEMTEYTKNNILVQAAQSMLAQANSAPQQVLSLLRG